MTQAAKLKLRLCLAIALCAAAFPAAASPAAPAAFLLPSGTKLVLPKEAHIKSSWIIPPTLAMRADTSTWLAADWQGSLWIVFRNQFISVPEKNTLMAADRPFQQVLWMGHRPVVRSFDAMGTFLPPASKKAQGTPILRFEPLTDMPLQSWRMAGADAGNIYVAGYNPRKNLSQIAVVGPAAGDKMIKTLFQTHAQITDVAGVGDGKTAYFASGPAIWKLDHNGAATVFWADPYQEAIRRLAYVPGSGIFYATDAHVGYAGRQVKLDFMACPRCDIAASADNLYVLLGSSGGGVLRLSGIHKLGRTLSSALAVTAAPATPAAKLPPPTATPGPEAWTPELAPTTLVSVIEYYLSTQHKWADYTSFHNNEGRALQAFKGRADKDWYIQRLKRIDLQARALAKTAHALPGLAVRARQAQSRLGQLPSPPGDKKLAEAQANLKLALAAQDRAKRLYIKAHDGLEGDEQLLLSKSAQAKASH